MKVVPTWQVEIPTWRPDHCFALSALNLLLLLFSVTTSAARNRQSDTSPETATNCQPVPHDVLWLRLNAAPDETLPQPSLLDNFRSANRKSKEQQVVSVSTEAPTRRRPQVEETAGSRSAGAASETETETGTRRQIVKKPNRRTARRKNEIETGTRITTEAQTRQPDLRNAKSRTIPAKTETETETVTRRQARPATARTRQPSSTFDGTSRRSGVKSRVTRSRDDDDDEVPLSEADMTSPLADDEASAAQQFRRPTWQCRMQTYWRRMRGETFPAYVQTGRCVQSRCMLGMYECMPRRYAIKVLQRLNNRCLPVPVVGNLTGSGYEHAWALVEKQIIVGCECTRLRSRGTYALNITTSAAVRPLS